MLCTAGRASVLAGGVRVFTSRTRPVPQVPPGPSTSGVADSLAGLLGLFPGSRESGTTVLTYVLTPPWAGSAEQYEAAQALAARSTGPQDAVVGVTGSTPARVERDAPSRTRCP